jgi:hypothetical protein
MKYVDYGCAWTIFAVGFAFMVLTEVRHTPGAVLDTPLLWIFVAMFNLLRLRNDDGVKGLRIFCLGANVSVCVFEAARVKMWGAPVFPSLIVAGAIFCETIFSIFRSRRASRVPTPV